MIVFLKSKPYFKFLLCFWIMLLCVSVVTAQRDPSAALEINSTTQGILPPRMTETQMQNIANAATGLLVFCTDCDPAQLYIFNNGQWENTSGGSDLNGVPLWQSLTNSGTYATNDIINYDGALYKNLSGTNSDTTPNLDATNWSALDGSNAAEINDNMVSSSSAWSSERILSEITATGNLIDSEGLISKELISAEVSSGQVILSYPQIDSAIYHIFYDTQPIHDLSGTGDLTTSLQSATITGLTNDTTYYFYVKPVTAPASARVVVRPGTPLTFSSVTTADGTAGATGSVSVQVTADPAAGGYKFILTTDGTPTEVIQAGTSYTFTNVPRFEDDIAVDGVVRTGRLATYTAIGHGLIAGQSIKIEGFNSATFNGYMIVESTTANSFSVFQKEGDASETTAAVLKVFKNHSIVVESLDDPATQNTLLTSSALSFNASEKYFVKNNGGFWAYNRLTFESFHNNTYGPRSLTHYTNPTAYNDWVEANTLFAPLVGLRRLPNVMVAPTNELNRTVPVYAVFDDDDGVYGSTYYLEDGDTTANQLTFYTQSHVSLTIDDNDTTYENGRGWVGTGFTDQYPHPSEATNIRYLNRNPSAGTYTSMGTLLGTQPTLSTVGERVGQAVFEATNRGDNRNIIVWVDLSNQRLAWRNNSSNYYVSFSTLGITISNSSVKNSLGVVSDGIDTALIGRTSGNFYTIQFNWVTNTAQLRATHTTKDNDIFNGNSTEEDATGAVLHAVNGKIFYNDNGTTTSNWAMAGSLYDPNDTDKIVHYYNVAGNSNGQQGTDTLHGVTFTLETSSDGIQGFRAYHTDKGHDGPGFFSSSASADTGWTYAISNILMIARGNGVF